MELDSRIKKDKRPLTCLDIEQAQEFVGKECIFSDSYDNYQDIEKYNIETHNESTAILKSIKDDTSNGDYIFENPKIKERYRLILPLEWVKESKKKYRPYTKHEFLNKFECGKPINIRRKDDDINLFIETMPSVKIDNLCDDVHVRLFEGIFNLKRLFDEFEWQKSNGEWQPFGVLDE